MIRLCKYSVNRGLRLGTCTIRPQQSYQPVNLNWEKWQQPESPQSEVKTKQVLFQLNYLDLFPRQRNGREGCQTALHTSSKSGLRGHLTLISSYVDRKSGMI
jgi:hypothetical protein